MNVRPLLAHIPTILTFAALGGAAFWGHSWKAPKFATLLGKSGAPEKDDWCDKHGVKESECLACHPELAGGDPTDWCK